MLWVRFPKWEESVFHIMTKVFSYCLRHHLGYSNLSELTKIRPISSASKVSHLRGVDYNIPTKVSENVIQIKAIERIKVKKDELNQTTCFGDYLSQNLKPIQEVSYWFHGTDHKAALNIIQEGIDVSKGRKCLDFSDGSGFYVTR